MMIRQATKRDAETLSDLAIRTYSDAFGHSMQPSDLAAHIEANLLANSFERVLEEDTVLVAEAQGLMVGFVQFGRASSDVGAVSVKDFELRRLYVQSNFQNQGLGTLLMQAALDHPDLQSAERVFLDVWERNEGAKRFYEQFGFQVIGEREFVVESGTETSFDLIMVRHAAV